MDRISALMDGELHRDEAVRLVPGLKEQADLREAWSTYHLIGDALRGEACNDCSIARSVAQQLAKEPTVLAPRRIGPELSRRWALPSVAAAAAVAMVTWMSLETLRGSGGPPGATAESREVWPVSVGSPFDGFHLVNQQFPQLPPPQIELSARALDPYLTAHQGFSPLTTIQGLAPYVRTVTSGAVETGR